MSLLALYVVIAVALVVAKRLHLVEMERVLTWPGAIVLAVTVPLTLFLPPRVRRCPECRGRELEIVPKELGAG